MMMNREKDSAIIHELVTSKYRIADRNRNAKLKFLNEMNNDGISLRRRDSEPTDPTLTTKLTFERLDLSIPGTPVSSRYLASLRNPFMAASFKNDSEEENEDDDKDNTADKSQNHSILQADLKKFVHEMDDLSRRNNKNVSHDLLQKYFDESDMKRTFRRDFSEVASEYTLNTTKEEVKSNADQYFRESDEKKTYKREFSDVVRTFDPRNLSGKETFMGLTKIGTPISSKFIAKEKLLGTIGNDFYIQGNEENEDPLSLVRNENIGFDLPIILDSTNESTVQMDMVEVLEENGNRGSPQLLLRRKVSVSSDISIPGTPISSRKLPLWRSKKSSESDDCDAKERLFPGESKKVVSLARKFVDEIEILVQKSFDDNSQEVVLKELEKITIENIERDCEFLKDPSSPGKNKTHVDKQDGVTLIGSEKRMEDYFNKSESKKTYTRTFSEVEDFNEAPEAVKRKIESYFRESEQNKSFKRNFSEAVCYMHPTVNFEKLMRPGTPVSSVLVAKLRREAELAQQGHVVLKKAQIALGNLEKPNFTVDDYFKQSQDRSAYHRNFSEVLDELKGTQPGSKVEIDKFFMESKTMQSYQRSFSQAVQNISPGINDILKTQEKNGTPLHYQRSSRASSVSSNCSGHSDIPESKKKSKKDGKKYGIDKYFATSLYRTAYHRTNNSRRPSQGSDNNDNELNIVEDEFVFGETDNLRRQEFQHDDETSVSKGPNDVNGNQTVQFWRQFLKPYNLNLQNEITVTKDDLLNNRTLE